MAEFVGQLVDELRRGQSPRLEQAPQALRPLLAGLLDGAAPEAALSHFQPLLKAAPADYPWPCQGRELTALLSVLSSGPELPRVLLQRPERLTFLREPALSKRWTCDEFRSALQRQWQQLGHEATAPDLDQTAQLLARFRNDHYVRLAAREFGLSPLEEVGLELSNLADTCLDFALQRAKAAISARYGPPVCREEGVEQPARITAIAMGKYGAQELNFCSDIDLVFIYNTDEGTAGKLSLHEFYAAVCRDVVRLLSQQTPAGFAFRVDLRLRPEGSRGPICNSLVGAERYYETWGGPYDRLAWLKARVAAGDESLGAAMQQVMHPFVFPRGLSPGIIDDIRQLSARIRSELAGKRLVSGWNVKLGMGGIRDVEFFVQALQLLHAGKQPALQERATLPALDKLLFGGLISEEECRQLAEAYAFYRRIEHRLQLYAGRQTHLLPDDPQQRGRLVTHMGYAPEAFEVELAQRRKQVSEIYGTLGVASEQAAELAPLLDPETPEQEARDLLAAVGFRNPHQAAERMRLLVHKPWGPWGAAHDPRVRALAGPLLREVCASPDPDAALGHLVELALRFGPWEGRWLMLAEHEEAMRLLCNLFGTSDFIARLFLTHPELIDQLLLAGRAEAVRTAATLRAQLDRRLRDVSDLELHFGVLEQLRNEEVLRIGLHDIAGGLEVQLVWRQLSDLAELVLQQLYQVVHADVVRRYGHPRLHDGSKAQMTIVGLGKLGGREMSYGSDLDLIFIYSGEGTTDGAHEIDNSEFFARLAQRLIRALTTAFVHGSLYSVDTRLRPSGSQGMLVSSFDAFRQYHTRAQIWERQVLLKARAVAGDVELGQQVQAWIDGYVYAEGLDAAAVRKEVVRLRRRMEAELAQETTDALNLKLGRGGLLDAEFVAQYCQLVHGHDEPALRSRATLQALAAARQAAVIPPGAAGALEQGYAFLRQLEGRIRIVRGRSVERLPAWGEQLDIVARRLGYRRQGPSSAGEQLLARYRECTEAMRAAFNRVMMIDVDA